MCVIFYQTKEQPILSKDDFMAMAQHNPHGFGYMANVDGIIRYKKGYFNAEQFYHDYLTLRNNPKVSDIACHFRIATGSNVDVANCHPFPITRSIKRIKASEGHADVCIMMNGIIGKSTKEFSDTALYTMNNLKSYYDKDNRFFEHFSKRNLMLFENEISGNRFIFMCKDGTELFGNGWSNYKDICMVSNTHWIPIPKYYYDYSYDYDDDYYWDGDRNCFQSDDNNRFRKSKSNKKNKTEYVRYKSYIDYLLEQCE